MNTVLNLLKGLNIDVLNEGLLNDVNANCVDFVLIIFLFILIVILGVGFAGWKE
ncbi:MAG: hypothetical protein ACPKPY_09995 [Nitrososphaeraceae archaeon]